MFVPFISLYKYNFLRKYILKIIEDSKNSFYKSSTIREIFKKYHKVTIGLYSYRECFIPGAFDPQTIIGRYCSIAAGVRAMNRNHPVTEFTTHPFFLTEKLVLFLLTLLNFYLKKSAMMFGLAIAHLSYHG